MSILLSSRFNDDDGLYNTRPSLNNALEITHDKTDKNNVSFAAQRLSHAVVFAQFRALRNLRPRRVAMQPRDI